MARAPRASRVAALLTLLTAAYPSPAPAQHEEQSTRGGDGAAVTPPAAGSIPAARATPPRALNYAPPAYPAQAERAGIEGVVTLQLDIDRNGRVSHAIVVESGGYGFDEAAVAAANKLEFEPARRADGSAVAARILYRYSFRLTPAAPADAASPARRLEESFAGVVLWGGGDTPLSGATVALRPRADAASSRAAVEEITTGGDGRFVFRDIGSGRYQVTVSAPGFVTLTVDEEIERDAQTTVRYRLSPQGDGLEVTVRGERAPREVIKRTLEQREISRIPGTNGDALRALQSLPGVARPPSVAGLLLIRGSAFEDTQTFIDGVYVPLVYHFGGLSSVVPTEMIEKIDFYPGNMSAQYGRVHGGIVDVGLRAPKDDGELHALGQVDLIDARLALEGPLPFLEHARFAAAARRSWIGEVLTPALEASGAGVTQVPVYYDVQLLIEAEPTPASRVRVGFFGSDDALELLLTDAPSDDPALSGNFGLNTAFFRIHLRYEHDLTEVDRLRAVAAIGRDERGITIGTIYFQLNTNLLTGRVEYARRLAKGTTINAGLDLISGEYTARFRGPGLDRPGQPPNQPFSTRVVQTLSLGDVFVYPAGYVELELAPSPRAKIVPGLRVDYQSLSEQLDVSPRVNGRFDLRSDFPRTTLKAGAGVFHQPPQVQEMTAPVGNPKLRSIRAIEYSLGIEQELSRHLEGSVEAFYKQLDDVVVGLTTATSLNLDYQNIGTGRVFGGELLLKYKPDTRFFGWVAYTLSRSTRSDGPGEPEQLVSFDQTHILTALGSLRLGGGWELGARLRLVSGDLATPYACDPEARSCDRDRSSSVFHAPSGAYVPIPVAATNSERLPLFHQLDLRIDKRWQLKGWQLSAYLDVQNAYNHANAEGIQYNFNYTARQYVGGLPILPSIGIRAEL